MNLDLVQNKTKVAFSRKFPVNDGVTPITRTKDEVISLSGKVVGKHACGCKEWVVVKLDRDSRKEAFDVALYPYKCLVVPVEEVILWKHRKKRKAVKPASAIPTKKKAIGKTP